MNQKTKQIILTAIIVLSVFAFVTGLMINPYVTANVFLSLVGAYAFVAIIFCIRKWAGTIFPDK